MNVCSSWMVYQLRNIPLDNANTALSVPLDNNINLTIIKIQFQFISMTYVQVASVLPKIGLKYKYTNHI